MSYGVEHGVTVKDVCPHCNKLVVGRGTNQTLAEADLREAQRLLHWPTRDCTTEEDSTYDRYADPLSISPGM